MTRPEVDDDVADMPFESKADALFVILGLIAQEQLRNPAIKILAYNSTNDRLFIDTSSGSFTLFPES